MPDRGDRGAGDREGLVAPVRVMICPEVIEAASRPSHQRHELQARVGRAEAADGLLKQRQVGERAEEREADHEADRAGHPEDGVREQLHRQHRLGGAALGRDEAHQRRGRRARLGPTMNGEPQS